ncbi:carbon-nitrogen hydrolase [Gaertneriomyces semiglobifer]|nr:carbon-nitrogen hydrolase [Gaertneriomyces semiglobifer]
MLAAVAQICSTASLEANQKTCVELIEAAAAKGAKMIFFPEASDFIALTSADALGLVNPAFTACLQSAAQANAIYISVGVHEQGHHGKMANVHLVISDTGAIVGRYQKIHLFDVDIPSGPRLLESAHTTAGTEIPSPVATPVGNLGLAVCYDLRFPEMSWLLRKKGAEILTYPSAFTIKTGQAHWKTLLRARAIETQCYVIAAAQVGEHNSKRASFGHAMIIDPWGK